MVMVQKWIQLLKLLKTVVSNVLPQKSMYLIIIYKNVVGIK